MGDRATYADKASIATDPRRAYRMAQRMMAADQGLDPIATSALPPGLITADHAGRRQLISSTVNFDRAVFAFDQTNYGPFTCNGQASATPRWTKPSGASTLADLRAYIGPTDVPLYIWVWATMGWALAGTGAADAGRLCAVLYDSLSTSASSWVAATNPSSDWRPADGNFHQLSYIGFFGLDPTQNPGGDWNVGMQMQYSNVQQVAKTTINRQSIVCLVSAGPVDGSYNTQPAAQGTVNGVGPNADFV